MNVKDDKVYILTDDKEFAIVKIHSKLPVKGKRYSGYEFFEFSKLLKLLLFFIIVVGLASYVYFTKYTKSDTSFIVDMNTRFKISTNAESKIVSIKAMDKRSETILTANSFFNKNYNDVLIKIYTICSAKDYFLDNPKMIKIYVDSEEEGVPLDFTPFKDYIEYRNFSLMLNENGK